jgi:hypothetical protein
MQRSRRYLHPDLVLLREEDDMSKPPLVIYHADCADGFCAAWVAWRKWPDAELVAARYGDPPPDCTVRRVYILDFSYSRASTEEILYQSESFLLLDHHATAEEELRGLDQLCVFDQGRSGAGMAWDHFFPGEKRPWLVDYVEDRDLWKFAIPDSHLVNAYLQTLPFDVYLWNGTHLNHPDGPSEQMLQRGVGSVNVIRAYCERVAKNTQNLWWLGVQCPVVCAPRPYVSELLSYVMDKWQTNIAIAWHQCGSGDFEYSLRSRGDVDVGRLAKEYGGGGHRHAAGFKSDEPVHMKWRIV